MYKLYHTQVTGNSYKVRLVLSLLGVSYDLIDVDIFHGENRTADYLALNPLSKVPILILPDGRVLTESNAILIYLAEGTRFLPKDRYDRAKVFQWMFFEQYSHAPYIAVARFWIHLLGRGEEKRHERPLWREKGNLALSIMDQELNQRDFLATGRYTIADIALYAYTHVAEEGEFDLEPYPAIRAWLQRVSDQPGHVPMGYRPDQSLKTPGGRGAGRIERNG